MAVWPSSRLRTSWASWAVVDPTAMAFVGSTSIWSSGASSARSFWTLTMPSMPLIAAVISDVAEASAALSSLDTMTCRPLPPPAMVPARTE